MLKKTTNNMKCKGGFSTVLGCFQERQKTNNQTDMVLLQILDYIISCG